MEISIFDPNYIQKQQVASMQRMAANQNALRVQAFNNALATYLANPGKGPVPVVPKKVLVSDAGEWTEGEFEGLVVPALPVGLPSGSLRPNPAAVPPDRLDQIIAILTLLNSKIDALGGK